MEIKLRGEMTIKDIRQALFEKLHEVEDDFAIHFSRGATLFINPTDGHGSNVVPRHQTGQEVSKLSCNGPYRSAADEYKM